MSWSSLSEDLWKQILQFVPLKDRLSSCSRVSRTLHRAAAAATQQVELSSIAHPSLFQWMQHHGQHLTSFRSWGNRGVLTGMKVSIRRCVCGGGGYVEPLEPEVTATLLVLHYQPAIAVGSQTWQQNQHECDPVHN